MKPHVKRILEKLSSESVMLAKFDTKNLQSEIDDVKSDLRMDIGELDSVFDELGGIQVGLEKANNDAEGILRAAQKMRGQIEDAQDTLREMDLDPSQLDKKLLEITNVVSACDNIMEEAEAGMTAITRAQQAIQGV